MDRDEILRALIGATAMGFHGVVRATEDVDLIIRPTADNVAKLRSAFHAVYDDPQIDEISTADLLGDYPAVRYYPPTGDLYFDVLTRLGEAVSFDSVDAETKRTEGIAVRVATPTDLYRMKKGTVAGPRITRTRRRFGNAPTSRRATDAGREIPVGRGDAPRRRSEAPRP